MDETLTETEEGGMNFLEEANDESELSSEATEEVNASPDGLIGYDDYEELESVFESTFVGSADETKQDESSKNRPGDDGIFMWDGGEYEDEFSRFDECDDQKLMPFKRESSMTKSISRAVLQAPDKDDSKASASSEKSTSQSTSSTNRLKIQRQQDKPCGRDRMRQWLNRGRSGEAQQESFLGVAYSERRHHLNTDYPCRSVKFPEKGGGKSVEFDEEKKTKRHLCACKLEEWKPYKASDPTDSKEDMTNTGGFKKREASSIDVTKPAPDTCRCSAPRTSSPESPASTVIKAGRDKVIRKLGICTCGIKHKQEQVSSSSQINQRVKEKIRRLMVKMLKRKKCHCPKTGWMPTQKWSREKHRCICKHLIRQRRRYQRAIANVWQKERDRCAELEIQNLKEAKVEQLYKRIGPKLAAEYRQLALKTQSRDKRPKTDFVKKVLKEFGSQMQKYKLQSIKDGTAFTYYDTSDYTSFQFLELPSGSTYYGQFSPLGMEGKCIYSMSHGPIFVGTMVDGKMEGPGRLIYPNGGLVEGVWMGGSLYEPKYTFSDGLKFEPTGWKYCRMPDRRFVSEIIKGMNSPDNVQLCANHPARQIPKGCLDAGEGFYDPKKKIIIHPSTGKTLRIVNEHEGQWIMKNCRREWFEEVPFSRYMHENWYAGTVFTPPSDEASWFQEEFPKVHLPYTNVDDVIEARKRAVMTDKGNHQAPKSVQPPAKQSAKGSVSEASLSSTNINK